MKALEWTDRQLPDDEEIIADAFAGPVKIVVWQHSDKTWWVTLPGGLHCQRRLMTVDVDPEDRWASLPEAKAAAEEVFREWWREVGRAMGELE